MDTTEVIDSWDLGEGHTERILLDRPGEARKMFFLFRERMPKRFCLDVSLRAPNTRAEVFFAFVGRRDASSEVDVRFSHDARHTFGRVIGKAALFDDARLLFRAMLAVASDAQGADTYFLGRALMMSPAARADIFPHLEIKTSNVKASHGSSVGSVRERDLFYLATRGVSRRDAERIFLGAFFRDLASACPPQYRPILFQHEPIA